MERLTRYLVGLVVAALGVILIDRAGMGLLPFEALFQGLSARLAIPVTVIRYVALIAMIVSLRWSVAPPDVRSLRVVLVWASIVGVVDAVIPSDPMPSPVGALLGLGLLGVGVGVFLTADLGAGPTDLLPKVMSHHFRVGPAGGRVAMDSAVCLVALMLGGSLGPATIMVAVFSGPIVAATSAAVSQQVSRPEVPRIAVEIAG